MDAWKIKHKPTEDFFQHAKLKFSEDLHKYIKTNLSCSGKFYYKKPTEREISLWLRDAKDRNGKIIPLSDWEVIKL